MYKRMLIVGLFVSAMTIATSVQEACAQDYVWARTNWGASNINRPYSSMSNGYGGYYVPRNAYGNNYDGRRVTNPNGFFIPQQGRNYR